MSVQKWLRQIPPTVFSTYIQSVQPFNGNNKLVDMGLFWAWKWEWEEAQSAVGIN